MTWLAICLGLGAVLGLGTYLFLGAAMEGVGTVDYGFWKGLRYGGWVLLLTCLVIWSAICVGVYWSWMGLHALMHIWS